MSFIDNFLGKNVGCLEIIGGLNKAIGKSKYHWL